MYTRRLLYTRTLLNHDVHSATCNCTFNTPGLGDGASTATASQKTPTWVVAVPPCWTYLPVIISYFAPFRNHTCVLADRIAAHSMISAIGTILSSVRCVVWRSGWEVVPSCCPEGLPIHFVRVRHFCFTMYRLVSKHSERLKSWQV